MKSLRFLTIGLWLLTVPAFLLPWIISIPLFQRWSIAAVCYLLGFLLWITCLMIMNVARNKAADQTNAEPPSTSTVDSGSPTDRAADQAAGPNTTGGRSAAAQKTASLARAEKSLRALVITHLLLVPLLWIGTGIYAVNWWTGKNSEWNEAAQARLADMPALDRPELQWMKDQLLPLLTVRYAITDPELNDARWLIDRQLNLVNLNAYLQTIEQTVNEVKTAAQLKAVQLKEIKGNAQEKKEQLQQFRSDARALISQLGPEQRKALLSELQQFKAEK